MGGDREVNSYNAQTKIQQSLAGELGVSNDALYKVWKGYVNRKLDGKDNIIGLLKSNPIDYNTLAIDYFTTLGFELFTVEFIEQEIKRQRELDFGK